MALNNTRPKNTKKVNGPSCLNKVRRNLVALGDSVFYQRAEVKQKVLPGPRAAAFPQATRIEGVRRASTVRLLRLKL